MNTGVLTPFGKAVKKRLIDLDRTQAWLIKRVAETTDLYFDRSYMYKIQTGQLATPSIIQAICKILDLSEELISEKEVT